MYVHVLNRKWLARDDGWRGEECLLRNASAGLSLGIKKIKSQSSERTEVIARATSKSLIRTQLATT